MKSVFQPTKESLHYTIPNWIIFLVWFDFWWFTILSKRNIRVWWYFSFFKYSWINMLSYPLSAYNWYNFFSYHIFIQIIKIDFITSMNFVKSCSFARLVTIDIGKQFCSTVTCIFVPVIFFETIKTNYLITSCF